MKEDLVKYWTKNKIITDRKLIEAFRNIPREKFVKKEFLDEAYDDQPLPTIKEQTISQPTTVMIMLQALSLKEGDKVLEIGTGSGYNAALISYVIGKKGIVYTVEIIQELVKFAEKNISKLKIKNIKVIHEDGSHGYRKARPYDKIIVTAACPEIPKILVEQLKINGILVAPVGPLYNQKMLRIQRKKTKLDIKNLGDFVFVKLTGKYGFK